ncbi:hypothetical protein HN385_05640 [archaeon]|jgi:hypothetical protein|nr:hypothetical protein [archaeon]MBT3451472.1 hypothetical protein [archaeon]MBT6868534.1 hypothetical protein [archaeon]MBT7193068.1 hypothetical protein [archaeon]MBT7381157.1 hypothetical protein [archaeon]
MGWVFDIINRKNKNAAISDAEKIFETMKIDFNNELKAEFIYKFWTNYKLTQNKILVKETSLPTEAAKLEFIDWIDNKLNYAISDIKEFKDEKDIKDKVNNLATGLGIITSILQFGITSKFLVQWEFSGEYENLVNKILNKFEAIMILLHQIDSKIALTNLSERAQMIMKSKRSIKSEHNIAREILINVAIELATKG